MDGTSKLEKMKVGQCDWSAAIKWRVLTEENGERERQQLNHALGVNYIKIIGHLKSNGNFEVPYAQVM